MAFSHFPCEIRIYLLYFIPEVGQMPTFFNGRMGHMDFLKSQIENLVRHTLDEEGFHLVDIVIKGKPSSYVLQFFMDRDGGLTISDCVYLNRKISDLLELRCQELKYGSYRLEVSSPGIDRPLCLLSDFQRNIGRNVSIVFRSEDMIKNIQGKILETKNDSVYLQTEGTALSVPMSSIINGKINLKW